MAAMMTRPPIITCQNELTPSMTKPPETTPVRAPAIAPRPPDSEVLLNTAAAIALNSKVSLEAPPPQTALTGLSATK